MADLGEQVWRDAGQVVQLLIALVMSWDGEDLGIRAVLVVHPRTPPPALPFGAARQMSWPAFGAFALAAVLSGIPRRQRCRSVASSRCLEQAGRFAPRARPLTGR
jgi:hypothetical protein